MSSISKKLFVVVVLFFCVLGMSVQSFAAEEKVLQMATTTSTDNTGLLDYLAPLFKADTGIELIWVAVGTGKALALGKNCDVDVLLVHAPAAEKKYIAEGSGVDRREVMFNDFVFIGPKADSAGIKGASVEEALKNIFIKKGVLCKPRRQLGHAQKETESLEGLCTAHSRQGTLVHSDGTGHDKHDKHSCRTRCLHDDRPRHLHQIRI